MEILEHYRENPSSLDADELTDVADYYSYIGKEDEAQAAVQLAFRMFPDAIAPLSFMAHDALTARDIEKAKSLVERIPDKSDVEYKLLTVELHVVQGQIDQAENLLNQLLAEVDDDDRLDDLVIDAANIYLSYNLADKAEKWLDRDKDCPLAEYKELRAKVLLNKGMYKESIAIFNELIDQDPYAKKYWNALATAQFMTGDYEEAANSSGFTLAIDPDSPEGLFTKGNCLYHMDRYDEALTCYEHYARLVPDDELGYLNAGTCMVNTGQYEKSIGQFEKALNAAPPDSDQLPLIYQEMAHAYCALQDYDKAMECVDLAEKLSNDPADIIVLRGHLLLCKGMFKAAMKSFSNAVCVANADPNILLRIIVSLYDNDYVRLSYKLFKQLFDMKHPGFNSGYSYMAICCHDMNNQEEFLHYVKLAAESNPREARIVLGKLFPEGMDPKDYFEYAKKKLEI